MSNNYSYNGQHRNMADIVEKYREQINKILGLNQWQLKHTDTKTDFSEKLDVGRYALKLTFGKQDTVASFELHPMINCCGMCVSTKASVSEAYRGRGLGTLLNSLRIDIARHCGYGCLLCTDIESNTYQRKVLARNGWTDVHKFVNPRTKNTVFLSVINL